VRLVVLFALLIILQGALRKWFLPSLASPLYFVKDVALVGALILFSQRHRFELPRVYRGTMLPTLWGTFAAFVCIQAFNLNQGSPLVGVVLGIRSYLLYTTLLVLMPYALQRLRRPERLVLAVSVVFAAVMALGMYQYYQPSKAWINKYVAEGVNAVAVQGRARITGTFSYIGGMAAFMGFGLFFTLATFLVGYRRGHKFYMWVGGLALAIALIAAPMNGSRSVIFGFLVPLPFIAYAVGRGSDGVLYLAGACLVLGLGWYVASGTPWLAGWDTLMYRIENSEAVEERSTNMLLDPLYKVKAGGIFGYGAGSTHQAAGALSSRANRPDVGGLEGEMGRVVVELGILGALLFFALKLLLAWIAWQALQRAHGAWEEIVAITCFGTLFLATVVGMIVFNHIAGAIYWICAGSVVWLWAVQQERARAAAQQGSGGGRGPTVSPHNLAR
jgi:hypothetical protein